ncbi:MAG: NADH-quinone oxidoreductase subunit J [Acidobacteriota bacterium]|jgi:NADH-quinone oxidoreductase subunit J|nr:NADH-quinone oxidoreductase subunit J [Acidobacteriota bacterium]
METVLFYFFGGIALLAAISVVVQRRVFYSGASLIVCLCSVAVLYLLLEAPFIAAIQIIVYAGAIMVLFLFVIMLLDPFSATVLKDKRKYLGYLAVVLGIIGFVLLYPFLRFYDPARAPRHPGMTADSVGSVEHLGQVLFREYLLPFEATSILILVAIIGVVVLAKRQRQS